MIIKIWAPPLLSDSGEKTLGGVQTYIKDLAAGLLVSGNQVEVVFPYKKEIVFNEGGVSFIGVPSKKWFSGEGGLVKADLNIVGTSTLMPKKLSMPCIGIQHGILWDRPVHGNSFWNRLPLLRDSLRMHRYSSLASKFSHLVCVDLAYPQFVASTKPPLDWKNITYIPNYSHLPERPPTLEGRIKKIIFPRRFVKHRGVDIAINLAKKYAGEDLEFCFIGEGPEEERVRNSLKELNSVSVYSIPYERRLSIYDSNTLVIIPSLSTEGTSLVCLEAWSRGAVVVGASVGGIANLIIDNSTGMLCKPTIEAFDECISRVLKLPDQELARIRDTSYQALVHSFSYERWLKKWNLLCGSLVK